MNGEKVSGPFNRVEVCQNQGSTEERCLSPWQLVFQQSRVNNGAYDGDRLPTHNWDWPQDTWLQRRLRYLRKSNRTYAEPDLRGAASLPVSTPGLTGEYFEPFDQRANLMEAFLPKARVVEVYSQAQLAEGRCEGFKGLQDHLLSLRVRKRPDSPCQPAHTGRTRQGGEAQAAGP